MINQIHPVKSRYTGISPRAKLFNRASNKKIIYFGFITLILGGVFLLVSPVSAQTQNPDDLIIIFTPNPLFDEANFLPGDTVSGFAEVKNKSGSTQQIITEAINIDDPDNMGAVFDLKIKDTGTTYFNGTLAKFFDTREVELSYLANGVTTTYEFLITFQPGTEDKKYQGKTLKKFDIIIGFSGDEGGEPIKYACNDGIDNDGDSKIDYPADPGCASLTDNDELDVAPPGSSGGGGLPAGLTILNEIPNTVTTDSVTITWMTSYFSTSEVIYDIVPGKFDLSVGPSKYGYAYIKEGDDSGQPKVTSHTVTIYGLTPGTKYYFRCVSHGSLAIGREYSFTTLAGSSLPPSQTLPGASELPNLGPLPGSGGLSYTPPSGSNLGGNAGGLAYNAPTSPLGGTSGHSIQTPETGLPVIGEETTGQEEDNGSAFGNFLTGALSPFFKFLGTIWFWIILIIVLLLLYFIMRKRKNQEKF